MKVPFKLEEGIFFEDSGQILRWNDSLEIIKNIDNPEISSNGNNLKWFNKTCFGGQIVNVTIEKDEYYNTKNKLEFVDFELNRNDPWGVYKKFSEHFKTIIGQPSEIKDDGYGRPTVLWNIKDLQIILGVGERFVEYEIFGIHKGKKFWNLNK